MPYHVWGDTDFDWNGLQEAGAFIHKRCMRRARLCIHYKEKYGTLRYEWLSACFFSYPIHSLMYPGYLYYRYSKRMRKLDKFLFDILVRIGAIQLIGRYQEKVFKNAVRAATIKYPHLKEEIIDDLNWTLE